MGLTASVGIPDRRFFAPDPDMLTYGWQVPISYPEDSRKIESKALSLNTGERVRERPSS